MEATTETFPRECQDAIAREVHRVKCLTYIGTPEVVEMLEHGKELRLQYGPEAEIALWMRLNRVLHPVRESE